MASNAPALFIPLKREHYEAFVSGEKNIEYRAYCKRWNENVCRIGRHVVLSLGYGKQRRVSGVIVGYAVRTFGALGLPVRRQLLALYGEQHPANIACIHIAIEGTYKGGKWQAQELEQTT